LAVAASFLVLGNYLKNALIYDYHLPRLWAVVFTCGLPLILFFIGLRGFIETLGLAGTVIGAAEGTVIILIFREAKKIGDRIPEYSFVFPGFLLYFLIGLLVVGAVAQITYFIF
jgi:hypothetical protein